MDDEALMSHFESSHADDLAMEFRPEPGRIDRRLSSPSAWKTYHETLHRLMPEKYGHNHDRNEEATELPSTEQIYVVVPKEGGEVNAFMSDKPAHEFYRSEISRGHEVHSPEPATLHRPDLRPIYGGPTLLEALWDEMDRLMEGLMTQTDAEDGGDKYRAQQLAWVLAIVTDPYAPSVDKIRKETMERWEAAQAEAEREAAQAEQNASDRYNDELSGGTGDEFA